MISRGKIGVFDSGIGGLTVARAIMEKGYFDELLYFGDIAHLPYGDKSEAAIQSYSLKIARYLLDQGCETLVIACNSASASATELVKEYFQRSTPVINVIDPMVEFLAQHYGSRKIGLIGTKRTIGSGIYQEKIQKYNAGIEVFAHATPLLVPLIEEDKFSDELKMEIIREYLEGERLENLDALVLGCTHYPLLRRELEKFFGEQVDVLESSKVVADHLVPSNTDYDPVATKCTFFVSDITPAFERSAQRFFGNEVTLQRVELFDAF